MALVKLIFDLLTSFALCSELKSQANGARWYSLYRAHVVKLIFMAHAILIYYVISYIILIILPTIAVIGV